MHKQWSLNEKLSLIGYCFEVSFAIVDSFFFFFFFFFKEGAQHHRQHSACMEGLCKCVLGGFGAR